MKNRNYGFTLIELLIVVAIIAILAAIAIPNFLAAQTRSKVARVQSEERTIATALESYYVDNTMYPWYVDLHTGAGPNPNNLPQNNWTWLGMPLSLSTPVAYISSALLWDPFPEFSGNSKMQNTYRYMDNNIAVYLFDSGGDWLWLGPTQQDARQFIGHWAYPYYESMPYPYPYTAKQWMVVSNGPDRQFQDWKAYDPTNGTISNGDIERFGP